MKKPKTVSMLLIGCIIGVIITLGVSHSLPLLARYFGPPHVTLMNASGEEISDITISLGQAKQVIPILKHQHAVTVPIQGEFGESSTHIEWTDSTGRHTENADDYMESYGFYHARVVITPDKKATAVDQKKI